MATPRSFVLSSLAAAALATCALPAQALVVPASHASAEGAGGLMVPGLGTPGRVQVLLDGQHLATLSNRSLRSLSFRRDLGDGSVMGGAALDLVVRLAPAARAVGSPAMDFAANLGVGAVEVFRGRVQVAPSGSPTAGSVAWTAPYTIEIPFQTDYPYTGGDLVVDVEGLPVGVADFHWVADQATSDVEGVVRTIGHGCGPFAPASGVNSGVAPRELVPGQIASFGMFGEPGALAILGIDLAPRAHPLDLAPFGAPGCSVFVDPAMTASTVVSSPLHVDFPMGHAEVRVPLPGDASFFGARFATQWFEFATVLRTYHGFDCTVATSQGALGMTMVSQETGYPVRISLNSAPALRLGVR